MIKYPLKNWAYVESALFLTEKEKTIYAYVFSGEILIGTEEEICSELKAKGYNEEKGDDFYYIGKHKIPRDQKSFLTTMKIVCIN